ncbi:MAG: tetratricopeptide repeat protein [Runella sp.]
METFLLILLLIPYLVLRYYLTDHDTPSEKEKKRLAEGIEIYEKQSYEEAFEYFDRQVKENRKSAIAYAYRGKCNRANDNIYSALYDFSQALSYDNTLTDVHLDKGRILYELEEYDEAFLSFDKAVWFSQGHEPEALRWRALARLQKDQIEQAENDLKKAVKLGDENAAYVLSQPPFGRKVKID